MQDNGSRWGVKGSNEVSEGLTAVYRYEAALDLSSAELGENGAGRLSSLGLSGGFGTVTLGHIYSASYNHVGALTDNGVASSNQNSPTVRTSSNLSYSASTGPISFQLDAGMGAGTDRSLDRAELGLSFDTGAATIGMAFTTEEDIDGKTRTGKTRTSAFGVSVPVGGLTLAGSWMEKKTTKFATDGTEGVPGSPPRCQKDRWANAMIDTDGGVAAKYPQTDDPAKMLKHLKDDIKYALDTFDKATGKYGCPAPMLGGGGTFTGSDGKMYSDIVIESTFLDAVDPIEAKGPTEETTDKDKQMRFSVTGPLGDSGMSFAVNVHNNPDKKGVGENPWNAHVSKSLGGGASLAFEYIDNDSKAMGEENQALVQLKVDF